MHSLSQFWSPIFDGSNFTLDPESALNFLNSMPNKSHFVWSKFRMPDRRTFRHLINTSKDNSLGFDGLPFSALRLWSDTLVVLLEHMRSKMHSFSSSSPDPLYKFNHMLQTFIPKKATLLFEQGVACRAGETRSLSCKNTDNKIICQSIAHACMPVVASAASRIQQGFISKRYFTNNITEVDAISRIYSNLCGLRGNAIAAYFDFDNAFPSIFLQWLFIVLVWIEMPLGVNSLIHRIYYKVQTFLKHAGRTQ